MYDRISRCRKAYLHTQNLAIPDQKAISMPKKPGGAGLGV